MARTLREDARGHTYVQLPIASRRPGEHPELDSATLGVRNQANDAWRTMVTMTSAPRSGPDAWDLMYQTPPAWDIGRPQPALLALASSGALHGRVLDIGCGTGEHVLMAAAHGLDATGV